jgi:LacI family transcriptional regulator, repressor for deo operon, udp, cdd, tsx, nupC, and nupG
MAKIVDVAKHAGVSTATVSRVLNGKGFVTQELRERVETAVAKLGYNPNMAARNLRTLRSSKVLLLVPDISNPFFGKVIRGAEQAARLAGFAVVLGDTRNDPAFEDQYATMLARREVDGLIFLGHRLPKPLRKLVAQRTSGVPVVNGCEPSSDAGISSVHIDNVQAGRDATRHLRGLGHRRIGVVTGPLSSPLSQDRLAGAKEAMGECDDGTLIVRNGDFSIESGFQEAGALIAEGVTALFCFSDEMALGAMSAIRDAGLACPGDISVIGFDDVRFASFSAPSLTTISQPADEIGGRAMELLLRHIADPAAGPEMIVLPHRLVVRDSSGPVALLPGSS